MWVVNVVTTLAGLQLSFDFLGPYGSIQFRTLHHCVCISLSLADKLWGIVAYIVSIFFFLALCSFLVTLNESVFSVYKLILRGRVGL